ncbi:MAG: carbonate dehydratase [Bacteroidetes bacterium]|nr:MAG: carbonate dehydratase [Bacteroidota bacterium]
MDAYYKSLLDKNKAWVEEKLSKEGDFFDKLAEGQQPPLLWIGCADSRVPANQIIGAEPGEVFVHRNIANLVVSTDMNLLSVLNYAVDVLKVKHVIVCGHYGCGGVKAAMSNHSYGLIDGWLKHIKDVYRFHNTELDAIKDDDEKFNRFVELNVKEQVYDLAKTSILQKAWDNGQKIEVHGWVYSLATGIIKDLDISFSNNSQLDKTSQLEL